MKTNRRMLLGGLLGGGLLSLLRDVRPARAATARKRLVIWFTPNGTIEEAYRPTGSETNFQLGTILSPLEAHRDSLLLFGPKNPYGGNIREERGISIRVTADGPSGGHDVTKLLTGVMPITVEGNSVGGGISVDQHVAATIAQDDAFSSVELGVRAGNPSSLDYLNYAAAGQTLPMENNPSSAFASLFAGIGQGDPEVERRRERRREVLRSAREEVTRLKPKVSASDRARLDIHEGALVDLDARLSKVFECAPPKLKYDDVADWEENWDSYLKMADVSRAQTDILATALGCGITHVATMQLSHAATNAHYPHLSHDQSHHSYSHGYEFQGNGPGIVDQNGTVIATPEQCKEAMIDIQRTHMAELAYFIDRLKEMPEADGGTVFDNTLIFVCNEMSDPVYHTHQNMPYFLAGSAGGALRTGRYVTYENASHCDLLTSICQAMGLSDERFGDPAFCNGPLAGLT
jgi:hypothetical protein